MGRMQMKGKGKGISSSALPYKRKAPKWVTLSPSAVSDIIVKLAKKGIINAVIGIIVIVLAYVLAKYVAGIFGGGTSGGVL